MPKVAKQTMKSNRSKLSKPGELASAWDMADTMSLLLYGRSGTGKTTLWATFPKPILVLVCSGGNRPGELKSIDTPENRKSVKPLVIQRSKDVLDCLIQPSFDYQTVVLDHASGMQDLVLKEILGLDEIPAGKSWGLATQQQYGQCTLQCKELFRSILNLQCHRVIVAQEREFNTDTDGELLLPYVGAALMPSLVGWLNPACDYIVQTFIRQKEVEVQTKLGTQVVKTRKKTREVEYCVRTGPHEIFQTKFRIPKGQKMPEVIVDASFQKIQKLVKGG